MKHNYINRYETPFFDDNIKAKFMDTNRYVYTVSITVKVISEMINELLLIKLITANVINLYL